MPRLPGEVSEIEGQDSDQEHFHIVDQLLVPKDVPAEMIPGIATSVALVRGPETLSDVSLPHIDRRRTVVQDVDALTACFSSRQAFIFYVLGVACPPLAELMNQYRLSLPARCRSHEPAFGK